MIRNDEELKAAIERADQLLGCTDDSDEEQELAEIATAIEVYTDAMKVLRNVGGGEETEPGDAD